MLGKAVHVFAAMLLSAASASTAWAQIETDVPPVVPGAKPVSVDPIRIPGNIRRYHAIALDVGDQDALRADTAKLHAVLDAYGIANSFEVYAGNHTNKLGERFQNHVLPFFSGSLCFETDCRDTGSRE